MGTTASVHSLVSSEVEDFAAWKKGFDAGAALRDKYGIRLHGVYSAHDNPNHVTVHTEAPSQEAVQRMMADPDFHGTAANSGVKGRPEVKTLHKHY